MERFWKAVDQREVKELRYQIVEISENLSSLILLPHAGIIEESFKWLYYVEINEHYFISVASWNGFSRMLYYAFDV